MSIVVISGPAISIAILAQWTVPSISMADGGTFDLKPTLPPGTPAGGKFAVLTGTLPGALTLNVDTGILADPVGGIGASASGITFSYTFG